MAPRSGNTLREEEKNYALVRWTNVSQNDLSSICNSKDGTLEHIQS